MIVVETGVANMQEEVKAMHPHHVMNFSVTARELLVRNVVDAETGS
jgi:hypothetical protein